jgi:xanthine dehydrogenase YagR molybdenum-binding subunit
VSGLSETVRGPATTRIDGRDKVTGRARYGADFSPAGLTWAALKISPIARGSILEIDERAARTLPGVLDILTYRNVGDAIKPGKLFSAGGYMGSTLAPLQSAQIAYGGQIVAVVVAESAEIAREATGLLDIQYQADTPAAGFDSSSASEESARKDDRKVGDFESAWLQATVKIDQRYSTPTQHHNPLELFATTASWENGQLTIWESSQNVWGNKNGLAEQLGISADDIRIISPFIGGAFGSRGSLTQRTALIALAARRVSRPVKLVVTRREGFSLATYRAETRHRIRLAASSDGTLVALSHDGWEVTSRPDPYSVAGTDASTRLYACPAIASSVTMVHADRNTPGFMRSPPETPYLFALESAMDELAYALNMDPVELRLRNDTQVEPIKGLPYTSRHLRECFQTAASAFGWEQRTPQPRSMRDGDWLVGWGTAATMYPTVIAPAAARVRLTPQGMARVQSATHEIGQGVRTAMAITASRALGIPVEHIIVETGDSQLPPAPVAGGSNSTASVCNAVERACDEIVQRLAQPAVLDASSPLKGQSPTSLRLEDGALVGAGNARESLEDAFKRIQQGAIEVYVDNLPAGMPADAIPKLYRGQTTFSGGPNLKDRIQFAFGAHFIEVRVHTRTCEVRTPRAVGAFAFGRIVNALAAKSQLMGGQIWGISAALHEATEIDRRHARYYNDDLAEYLIPVNADIVDVQTIMLPELDSQVNPLGIKGVGELGNVGMNAALANAIYHATGVRVRELPIRPEKLMSGS